MNEADLENLPEFNDDVDTDSEFKNPLEAEAFMVFQISCGVIGCSTDHAPFFDGTEEELDGWVTWVAEEARKAGWGWCTWSIVLCPEHAVPSLANRRIVADYLARQNRQRAREQRPRTKTLGSASKTSNFVKALRYLWSLGD